jgi:hypothetical protein
MVQSALTDTKNLTGANIMEKLIAACVDNFHNEPVLVKALDRLAKYDRKHPMARVLLSRDDQTMVNLLIGSN